jgi:DeoR family glycerol-3-phosphate regulon repressor
MPIASGFDGLHVFSMFFALKPLYDNFENIRAHSLIKSRTIQRELLRFCAFRAFLTSDQNPSSSVSQTFRHPEILEIARREGKVTVDGLAAHFGVTLQTIRRDLTDLAEAGRLERVHGGAVLPSGTANIQYEERRSLNQASKRAMAKACAAQIPNGISLFLNIGTSTEAVAAALLQHEGLMVVTNNMNVAQILAANPNCEIILTGGQLRRSDGGLVGNLAAETIRQFKFDLAVIGCSALDQDGDLLDFDIQEVSVSQTILRQSRKTYLVADHTKFSRSAPVRIGSLSQIDTLFTDAPLNDGLDADCQSWGTSVCIST